MKRPSLFLTMVFLTGPWPLPAQPEDDSRVLTGEQEELPESILENPVPWHDSLLELPEWMRREQLEIESEIRPPNHGAGLFPPQVWPLQPEPVQGPLIWDDALADRPGLAGGAESGDVVPVPLGPELLARYTSAKPETVFVDPQHVLRGRGKEQMDSLVRRWLNEQSLFKTTVLVFDEGQQLPADFDAEGLRREWFGESGESLLVFYFDGQPERTQTLFAPAARTAYGVELLRSVVDAAVKEAGRVSGRAEQFERFCYKMSVRLHWLSRIPLPDPALAQAAQAEAVAGRRRGRLLTGAALGVAGLAMMAAAAVWNRRRKRDYPAGEEAVVLPEVEIGPRFGAPHSGGFAAVITFARVQSPV